MYLRSQMQSGRNEANNCLALTIESYDIMFRTHQLGILQGMTKCIIFATRT